MKNIISLSCAALLAIASAAPSFAETRSAPGEWRPENAAALETEYSCDPDAWVRAVSATGETLYANNWTCQSGRASARGGRDRCMENYAVPNKAIIKYAVQPKGNLKCYPQTS